MIWLGPICGMLAIVVFGIVLFFDALIPMQPHPDLDKIERPLECDNPSDMERRR